MRATGARTYPDYLRILQNDLLEATSLMDRLTIHVTEFFRDPGIYRAVQEKVLPSLRQVPEKKVKIWCAGCSTGEEPYSVAIMMAEWETGPSPVPFEIFATDIDAASVRTAEKGEYPRDALKKIPKSQAARWFRTEGSKVWVSPELKANVRFRVHDLMGHWSAGFGGFHLIFCRNLLIYLTGHEQQKIYEQFAAALVTGGHLVLGLTETLLGPSRRFFSCLDVKHRIYQKSPSPADLDAERQNDG
jgi:chemotaxis protein methyltransferase CheR